MYCKFVIFHYSSSDMIETQRLSCTNKLQCQRNHMVIVKRITTKQQREFKRLPIQTSSFRPDDSIEPPNPQVNCTSKLSPNRLPRKNNEFPIVVIPYIKINKWQFPRTAVTKHQKNKTNERQINAKRHQPEKH